MVKSILLGWLLVGVSFGITSVISLLFEIESVLVFAAVLWTFAGILAVVVWRL